MNKLSLYFFDQEATVDFPKNLQNLKKIIKIFFYLTEESLNKINLCYNNNDSKILSIENETDFNSFAKKNINNLYLDCRENNDIYEEYLNYNENNSEKKDLKRINELIIKDKEIENLLKTKFKKEEEEILDINKLIEQLRNRKIELSNYIKNNKSVYEKEQKKIRDELTILQKKMGLPSKYEKNN